MQPNTDFLNGDIEIKEATQDQKTAIVTTGVEIKKLEKSRADAIRATFEPMSDLLKTFEGRFTELMEDAEEGIDRDIISRAKRLRLDIAKVRTKTEKIRKEEKEEYLRAGRAIDGVSNILKWAVMEKEGKLKDIELYYERIEEERINKLQEERVEELSKYVENAADIELGKMEVDVWEAYLFAKKKAYEDEQAAIKKAEEERKAKEAAEAKEKKELQDKLKKEEEARKQAEEELAAKKAAEEKAAAEEEARKQAELNKGDAAKVKDLINDLVALKAKYTFKSAKNKKMYAAVGQLLDKVVNYINK